MSLAMDKAAPEPRVGGSAGKGAGGGCHAPRAQRGHSRSRSEPTPPFSTSQSTEQPLKKKRKSGFLAGALGQLSSPRLAQVTAMLLTRREGRAAALLSLPVLLAGATTGCSPHPQGRQN